MTTSPKYLLLTIVLLQLTFFTIHSAALGSATSPGTNAATCGAGTTLTRYTVVDATAGSRATRADYSHCVPDAKVVLNAWAYIVSDDTLYYC